MTDLEKVSLRIFQELAALSMELADGRLPMRGEPIPPEMDARGEEAARHWLQTGRRPNSQEGRFAVFPRFWFANMFLQQALLHQKRQTIDLGRPSGIPAILLLAVWQSSGRAFWESQKDEFPWGG